ncbi:B2 bradykinin receptor [Solea solea]|uniref:B2 bradykinin receptor n=1 Tax=Solea solea TaxID=90069 RepID=UPI00272CFFAC|nr:B2 bradykinin receptor [Solea solea]
MTLAPSSIPFFSATVSHGAPNSTNGTSCPPYDGWEWLSSNQPVYILLIMALGIVLNVFVLMVFLFHKKPCTVAEIYLSNLAVSDLVLMCCLPFWAVNIYNDFDWPFGLFLCKAVNLGIKLNVNGSVYFIVLISIDRYMALVHPMSQGRMRRPKYAKLACVLMWGFGFILSLPTVIFREVKYLPEYGVTACFLDYQNDALQLILDGMLIISGFVIPISIILFCTVKITQSLKIQAVERFSAEKTEQRATTLILVVLLAFLICWVPFHVVTTLEVLLKAEILKGCRLWDIVDICNQLFTYLGFSNSVLNPLLYVIVGKNFRKKAREFFKQWSIRRTGTLESSSSQLSSLKTLK